MSTVDIDTKDWCFKFLLDVGAEYRSNKPRHGSRTDELTEYINHLLAVNTTTLKAELLAKIDDMYEHSISDIELIEHQTGEEPPIILKTEITKIVNEL